MDHPSHGLWNHGIELPTVYGKRKTRRGYRWTILPSGKRSHITMERSTIFDGKIHYFYGHGFNSYVCLPQGRMILTMTLICDTWIIPDITILVWYTIQWYWHDIRYIHFLTTDISMTDHLYIHHYPYLESIVHLFPI